MIHGHHREGVSAWGALISGPGLDFWTLVKISGPAAPEAPGGQDAGSPSETSEDAPAQRQPGQTDAADQSW
eukprot:882150-Alexandrium_andersonii.AAC.1